MARVPSARSSSDVDTSEPRESTSFHDQPAEESFPAQNSEHTSLEPPFKCSDTDDQEFSADKSMLQARQLSVFPFEMGLTFQNKLMQEVKEIRLSLSRMNEVMCQGFEKGEIKVSETFQQFLQEKQPSDDELKEHLKQLLQQELQSSWNAMCSSLCQRIRQIIQDSQSHASAAAQPRMQTPHKRESSKQKSTHGSESKESTPASPEFASGKWLPGRLGNVIIVMTQEDYSEVCQVLKEKDVDHQVYKEEEQLKGFTEVTALSPFKLSFTNADERKTSASDETKLSGDEDTKSPNDKPSDHTASASKRKENNSPKLEPAPRTKDSASSLAEANNFVLIDSAKNDDNDDGFKTNNLNDEVRSKIEEPVKDSKEPSHFSFEKLLENTEHRTLVNPTELYALLKQCEEYKQKCFALEQVVTAKSESLQQHESLRQSGVEREQTIQQNAHEQITKNQDNFSKMMDIFHEQVSQSQSSGSSPNNTDSRGAAILTSATHQGDYTAGVNTSRQFRCRPS